jgi:AraC-like DNA-binding protein
MLEGVARITGRGEEIELRKGDIFITDSRQEFTLAFERPSRQLTASLATAWIDGRVTRGELLGGMVLRDHSLARLWASHLAAGFAMAGTLSPTAAALFARHSIELLAQAIEEEHYCRPTPSEAARAAIYLRACHLIALKSAEPNLRPDQIARELGLSTRSLARIFAMHNQTLMKRVLEERVRQAAKLLNDSKAAHRTITEIAFACGFNDASHFGRTFAASMHMTPSQWRRRSS